MRRSTRRGANWDRLRGALWVLPAASVLCSLAAGATLAAVEVDESSWLGPLLFQGTAADARDLLIVVSATMITVTGLVFTLTVVALQIASTQFSPRLLRNFLRDRGNQVVLSIFVSTFAYATAGLHTVGARAAGQGEFVPRLAVSGSLFLGLLSLAALVYFIHHIARSIQIDTIMGGVERETLAVIDDTYPDPHQDAAAEERVPEPPARAVAVPAKRSGYLQAVDLDGLLAVALEHDLVLRLAAAVGDHMIAGTPLAWAWSAAANDGRPEPRGLVDPLDRVVRIGLERTMLQDVAFGIRQLADIANKALSPAINDPYTGVQSLQHLSVIIHTLAGRRLGDHLGRDAAGAVRAAVPFAGFADYLRLATAQIRRYGAKEPGVARALLRLLDAAGERVADPERRGAVARHVRLVMADAERETAQPADAAAVLADGAAVLARLERRPARGGNAAPGGGIIGETTTKESEMDDRQLLGRIGALVEEEHALERQATADGLDEEQQTRLQHLEVQLDQCWDLLRQRRARRDAGLDPEDAQVRPEGTVEGYLQ
ncbi:MAG TPA: DUF2254 family protein [Actinomycetota bacterium]|nr:DUF2254 family protein [Actinomycetota bacterium]